MARTSSKLAAVAAIGALITIPTTGHVQPHCAERLVAMGDASEVYGVALDRLTESTTAGPEQKTLTMDADRYFAMLDAQVAERRAVGAVLRCVMEL